MFIWRVLSTRWRVGLGLALAHIFLVAGAGAVAAGAVTGACTAPPSASVASAAPTSGGNCTTKGKGGQTAPPAPIPGGTLNVAVNCAGCGTPERTASSVGEGASWPAWAVAHLAAEDAMRQRDHDSREKLATMAGWIAAFLAVGAAVLIALAAWQAGRGGELRFTSHWGGFGGSTGGWQVTPALVALLLAVLLAVMAVAIVGCLLDSSRPSASSAPPMAGLAAPAEKK